MMAWKLPDSRFYECCKIYAKVETEQVKLRYSKLSYAISNNMTKTLNNHQQPRYYSSGGVDYLPFTYSAIFTITEESVPPI